MREISWGLLLQDGLATAKALGGIAILSRKSSLLKEWAYAGFFFDTLIAFTAHTMVGDGQGGLSLIALTMVIISRLMESRVHNP